jgi:hypothetical protein
MEFNLNLKAFAYPTSTISDNEPVSPCLCSFVYRWDDPKLATLLLVLNIPTAHGTGDSEFVLQYDADNLEHPYVKLATGKGRLEQPQLDKLVGSKGMKDRDIKTLDLSTEQLPPAWCPAGSTTFSRKPGLEPAFQRLVKLAKETKLYVVFHGEKRSSACVTLQPSNEALHVSGLVIVQGASSHRCHRTGTTEAYHQPLPVILPLTTSQEPVRDQTVRTSEKYRRLQLITSKSVTVASIM